MLLRGTQKKENKKLQKEKEAQNLVGPEYPGEGAMHYI